MKKQKIIYFCSAILLFGWQANAQTTLNTAGKSRQTTSMHHHYSIGEMALVHTATNGNITVTQGLLQPEDLNQITTDNASIALSMELYPNPTEDIVYLDFMANQASVIDIMVYDINGKIIATQQLKNIIGAQKIPVSLKEFTSGNYLLKAICTTNNIIQQHNFKIKKIN